jgi:hypothetical protein
MTPRAPTGNSLIAGAAMSSYPSRLALQMEAGTVWINKHLDILPYVPFGGGKSSGIGRKLGRKVWRSSPNSSSSTWRSEKRLVAGETPPATLPGTDISGDSGTSAKIRCPTQNGKAISCLKPKSVLSVCLGQIHRVRERQKRRETSSLLRPEVIFLFESAVTH